MIVVIEVWEGVKFKVDLNSVYAVADNSAKKGR